MFRRKVFTLQKHYLKQNVLSFKRLFEKSLKRRGAPYKPARECQLTVNNPRLRTVGGCAVDLVRIVGLGPHDRQTVHPTPVLVGGEVLGPLFGIEPGAAVSGQTRATVK